jgi:hypothetical protein
MFIHPRKTLFRHNADPEVGAMLFQKADRRSAEDAVPE